MLFFKSIKAGQTYLLGSRRSQFHDTNSIVGSATFLIKLNVTGQSINTDLKRVSRDKEQTIECSYCNGCIEV